MIRTILFRDRDLGRSNHQRFDQGTFEESTFLALRRLVTFDLRFGANVTHISATELHLQSRCMSDVDTTEFSGPENEMLPLFMSVRLCQEHCRNDLLIADGIPELLERLPHGMAANMDFLHFLAPFSMRNQGLHLCLLLPLGVTGEEDLLCASTMRFDDVVIIVDFMQENPELSFRETAAACGAV